MIRKVLTTLAAASLLILGSLSSAQSYSYYYSDQLEFYQDIGYTNGGSVTGSLSDNQGKNYSFSVPVWADDVKVFAFCDGDCDDIDLTVRTKGGSLVASDTGSDDVPRVGFYPSVTQYEVRIYMASCSSNPCGYRLGFVYK